MGAGIAPVYKNVSMAVPNGDNSTRDTFAMKTKAPNPKIQVGKGNLRVDNSGTMCLASARIMNADLSTAFGVVSRIGRIVHDAWGKSDDMVGVCGGVATGAKA